VSSSATFEESIYRFDLWLAFWHFCNRQWGGFMQLVSSLYSPKSVLVFGLILFVSQLFNCIANSKLKSLQQDLTENELVEMPSCNLAKTVHNKWKQ